MGEAPGLSLQQAWPRACVEQRHPPSDLGAPAPCLAPQACRPRCGATPRSVARTLQVPGFTRPVPQARIVSPGHPFLPEGGRARLGVCSTVAHAPPMGPHLVPQPPSHQVSRGAGDQRLTCSEDIFARTSGLGVPTTSMIRFSWSMSAWLRKGPTARHGLSWDPRPQTLGHCPDPAVLPLGTVIPRWHGVGQRRQDCPERARAHLP